MFAVAQEDDDGGTPLIDLEPVVQEFLETNRAAIEAMAFGPASTDSEKVLKALCLSALEFSQKHNGKMPTLSDLQLMMDAYFKKTGLGTAHCYELCENYVSWTEWGQNAIESMGSYWSTFIDAMDKRTAHLHYKSEKMDQILWMLALLSASNPYTYPLTLIVGLYYYDDIFPGKQNLIVDNELNRVLLGRMAYSGLLAGITTYWTRTWMHRIPFAGFEPVGWASSQSLYAAACASPVGLALGYILDVASLPEEVVVTEDEPPSVLLLSAGSGGNQD